MVANVSGGNVEELVAWAGARNLLLSKHVTDRYRGAERSSLAVELTHVYYNYYAHAF